MGVRDVSNMSRRVCVHCAETTMSGLQINIHSVSTSDYSWSPLFEYGEFYGRRQPFQAAASAISGCVTRNFKLKIASQVALHELVP